MAKIKYSLEDILYFTKEKGPGVVKELRTKLQLEDAKLLASLLRDEGMAIEAYDFPSTLNVWKSTNEEGTEYKHMATKQLIRKIAEEKGVDYRTFEGFKEILPKLTVTSFKKIPINEWGTTTYIAIQQAYEGSPSKAVLDLISKDCDFSEISKHNLKPYDFAITPRNYWKDKKKNPTDMSRNATKQLIRKIAEEKSVDYRTLRGFKDILPHLTQDAFNTKPINEWGTRFGGMINKAYDGSPSKAVLDLIYKDSDFSEILKNNFQQYDFQTVPQNFWIDKKKNPTDMSRNATKQLIRKIAEEKGVNYRTFEGFKEILQELTFDTFTKMKINKWETRLNGMLHSAYKDSPSNAVLDLISKDCDFSEILKNNLQRYDFPRTPANIWRDKNGNPTDMSRNATKQLIRKIAEEKGVNYRTFEGFKEILQELTFDKLIKMPINQWGTTISGALRYTYKGSPYKTVLDLIQHDKELKGLRNKITREMLFVRTCHRKNRAEGKYSTKVLIKSLKNDGLELSNHGFYSFSNGEKQTVRELLTEGARDYFGDKKISYFGLEGPSFGSYFALAQDLNINVKKSLIPERDKRSFNVMNKISHIRKVNKLLNGNSLYPIELVLDSAENALRKTDKTFDLIFLDWLGHLAPARINELNLSYEHLNERGIIATTTNMTPLSESRFQRQTNYKISQQEFMYDWAEKNKMQIEEIDYIGGDKKQMPMSMYILKK